MSTQYVVTLKKDSDHSINLLSLLLCLFAAGNFIYVQVRAGQVNYLLSLTGILILAGAMVNIILARRGRQVRYRYELILAALGWLGMPWLQWLALLYTLLAFLEYKAKRPLTIDFSPDQVVINSLIPRQYKWAVFSNIILKDGLLTLDFANNRLFQKEVGNGETDESAFNEYCRSQLKNP
jgi:hypothetical protein